MIKVKALDWWVYRYGGAYAVMPFGVPEREGTFSSVVALDC
ncbi:hypothetical protein [Neorhizobium sp. T25_13]|nr:hypothetical protein [Neorhizobium sp. T25_13]